MSLVRVLVASIGNPPPLHLTRHSAGHVLLRSILLYLSFPNPSRDSSYGGGLVSSSSVDPAFTFYQSSTLMNVSGPTLLKAWKYFSSTSPQSSTPALVILHDELELPSGQLKIRRGNSSAKGHNGVKSVQASLQGAGILDTLGNKFIRVGVGINRPVSRDRDDVSAFVLEQMDRRERAKTEESAGKLHEILEKEVRRLGEA